VVSIAIVYVTTTCHRVGHSNSVCVIAGFSLSTECFTDLDKLNLLMVFRFYTTAPAASNFNAWFKGGENRL